MFFFIFVLIQTLQAQSINGTCGMDCTWIYYNASKTLEISGKDQMNNYGVGSENDFKKLKNDVEIIKINDGLTTIGNYAFSYFKQLHTVEMGSTIASLKKGAFWLCSSLKSITFSKSLLQIEQRVFYLCSNLTQITLPDSLVKIDDYAFESCEGITSITFGKILTQLKILLSKNVQNYLK